MSQNETTPQCRLEKLRNELDSLYKEYSRMLQAKPDVLEDVRCRNPHVSSEARIRDLVHFRAERFFHHEIQPKQQALSALSAQVLNLTFKDFLAKRNSYSPLKFMALLLTWPIHSPYLRLCSAFYNTVYFSDGHSPRSRAFMIKIAAMHNDASQQWQRFFPLQYMGTSFIPESSDEWKAHIGLFRRKDMKHGGFICS